MSNPWMAWFLSRMSFVLPEPQGRPGNRRGKQVPRRFQPGTVKPCLEVLEDRINPSPFTPTGALGALTLASGDSIVFNTDTGQYQIDGGAWQSGGVLSGDPAQSTMLFNFTTINLAAGSTVSATGSNALGLLATGNVVINTDLNFAGQNGANGADGYGNVGGGGAGGGGGGGGVIVDTSGGTITDSGLIDVRGGTAGAQGQDQLPGSNGGGQGGVGGAGVLGGGNGGAGGDSYAGGNGGKGGDGAQKTAVGSGGGGGAVAGNPIALEVLVAQEATAI
jgi:hypothetical protein